MQIITLSPRGFGANTYVLVGENQQAIVIDPAQTRVESELIKLGVQAKYVLLTHCHFDHVGGVAVLQESGAKVLCSEEEKKLVGTDAELFSLIGQERPPYHVDEALKDGEVRELCGISIQTILTPGHTSGSCCYLVTDNDGERYLFTGDTLFAGSIGRTDFPTGNITQMRASLKKLCDLDGDMPLYAGHNDPTTLQTERKTNPFIIDA